MLCAWQQYSSPKQFYNSNAIVFVKPALSYYRFPELKFSEKEILAAEEKRKHICEFTIHDLITLQN